MHAWGTRGVERRFCWRSSSKAQPPVSRSARLWPSERAALAALTLPHQGPVPTTPHEQSTPSEPLLHPFLDDTLSDPPSPPYQPPNRPSKVLRVNGEEVLNLRHLRALLSSAAGPYIRLDLEDDRIIVLDRWEVID